MGAANDQLCLGRETQKHDVNQQLTGCQRESDILDLSGESRESEVARPAGDRATRGNRYAERPRTASGRPGEFPGWENREPPSPVSSCAVLWITCPWLA
jgi:hypothetical protein